MRRFLGELKRRRVLNTASFYVIGGWLLLQVAEVLGGMLPPEFMRWLLIGLAAGYPVALIVGWFFDITADGVRRTAPARPDEELPAARFIDHLMLGGHLAIVLFVTYLLVSPQPPQPPTQARTLAVVEFEDAETTPADESIGGAIAEELRQGLTRTAGLKVIGPRTSEVLAAAGESRIELADELKISSLLSGKVTKTADEVAIDARVITIPNGQLVWQASFTGPITDIIRLQHELMRAVVGAVAPTLNPDPVNGPRAEIGQCALVYDMVLRGRQLSATPSSDPDRDTKRQRGRQLIDQATESDPECALAWEAKALNEWSYSLDGFAKAGAAARRALELNDTLPEAWSILGEIAEQQGRWSDAEEYFLKGISSDPTNLRVNLMYSESLITRGRVREALRHVLHVYQRERASSRVNWRVMFAATYAGEWQTVLEHIALFEELRPAPDLVWWNKAYALLMKGERDRAMQIFTEYLTGDVPDYAKWYLTCVKARYDESLRPGLHEAMTATIEEYVDKEPDVWAFPINWAWPVISCDAWIGNGDLAVTTLLSVDITELQWYAFFMAEWKVLRQHPRFREMVVESDLLGYWRRWGWADYCRPEGEDDFRCD